MREPHSTNAEDLGLESIEHALQITLKPAGWCNSSLLLCSFLPRNPVSDTTTNPLLSGPEESSPTVERPKASSCSSRPLPSSCSSSSAPSPVRTCWSAPSPSSSVRTCWSAPSLPSSAARAGVRGPGYSLVRSPQYPCPPRERRGLRKQAIPPGVMAGR